MQLKLTNLQNVAPGNVATLKCAAGPGSPTYDQIVLRLSGTLTPAHIEWIRGKINGRIFYDEGTGTVINDRDDYRGISTDASELVLDFTEPKARNGAAEQLLTAIPGHLVQDLSFEIKLAAAAPAGGRIDARAHYRPPTNNPFIHKRLMTTQSFPAAGSEGSPNIMYLPVGDAGGRLKRVWIHEATPGSVTGVQLRIANNVVHEATRAEMERYQTRNELVPQAGIVVLDFIADGNLAGMINTSRAPNLEMRLVTSAGDTYTVYTDYVDPIGRL